MDLNTALCFGQLVSEAYKIPTDDLANRAGMTVSAGTPAVAYEVVTSIYANDLATDMNPDRGNHVVSIGLVLQATGSGDAVIAIRGTEGIQEWVQDAKFLAVSCPFLGSAGNTEDGFTAVYTSMTPAPAVGSPSLTKTLATLPWKRSVTSLTICGHSLGGALATLLALDVAANTSPPFNNPAVYTYASPRTGDPAFAAVYNHAVADTTRIANRMDLVPKLPLPPLYEHVLGLYELNPVVLSIPPKVLVKADIPCEHYLNTYLFLLSQLMGGAVQLDAQCVP